MSRKRCRRSRNSRKPMCCWVINTKRQANAIMRCKPGGLDWPNFPVIQHFREELPTPDKEHGGTLRVEKQKQCSPPPAEQDSKLSCRDGPCRRYPEIINPKRKTEKLR